MKMNVSQTLKSLKDEVMFEMTNNVRTIIDMRLICVESILRPHASDEQVSGIDKMKRLDLATKIYKADGIADVTAEEVVLLKMLVARSFGTMIAGRALQILDDIK